jgi:D-sedoheptulose 7-phosphate isomerase
MEKTMDNKLWFKDYFNLFQDSLFDKEIVDDLIKIKTLWEKAHANKNKIIFAGNGGSAAMSSHCAVDLTKNAGIRAINFNEADLITCFSNDYGYEKWIEKALKFYGNAGDIIVLISSSGKSENILNAAEKAKLMNIKVITLSGFNSDNNLRSKGDINLWVNSKAYNIVEMVHHIWLLSIVDSIIGSPFYSA